jgi:hypothetical protein
MSLDKMIELKTLKDLQKDYEWKYDTFHALKQEAIKWVKYLDTYPIDYTHEERIGARCILVDFFNLVEEDLK